MRARFAICGMIEGYNKAEPASFRFIMRVIAMRIRMQGFIVFDFQSRMDEFYREMGQLHREPGSSSHRRPLSTGSRKCPTRSAACSAATISGRCSFGSSG